MSLARAPAAANAAAYRATGINLIDEQGHEFGSPSAPRDSRDGDDLRHVPEHSASGIGDNVAFLPAG